MASGPDTDTSLLVTDAARVSRTHERFSPVHMSNPHPHLFSDVLDLTPILAPV